MQSVAANPKIDWSRYLAQRLISRHFSPLAFHILLILHQP